MMLRDVRCIPRLPSTSSPPAADIQLTPHTLQQLKDDDIAPLCANLGRFKPLKEINLVSKGMREKGAAGAEGGSSAAVEGVTCGCGRDGGGGPCNGVWCRGTTS